MNQCDQTINYSRTGLSTFFMGSSKNMRSLHGRDINFVLMGLRHPEIIPIEQLLEGDVPLNTDSLRGTMNDTFSSNIGLGIRAGCRAWDHPLVSYTGAV